MIDLSVAGLGNSWLVQISGWINLWEWTSCPSPHLTYHEYLRTYCIWSLRGRDIGWPYQEIIEIGPSYIPSPVHTHPHTHTHAHTHAWYTRVRECVGSACVMWVCMGVRVRRWRDIVGKGYRMALPRDYRNRAILYPFPTIPSPRPPSVGAPLHCAVSPGYAGRAYFLSYGPKQKLLQSLGPSISRLAVSRVPVPPYA